MGGCGGCGGCKPSFLVGVAPFLVLVISESDESEYVISNVLGNVLVLNYLSFKVDGRNILVTCDQIASSAQSSFAAGSRSMNSMISALFKRLVELTETCGHAC